MDRLVAMEAFVRAADGRSFSQAARQMRLSRSVVSRHIASLEGALGARLLQRTTRTLTLTEAGRLYLERARRVLAEIDDAERSVGQLSDAPRGQLRVSAPMSFGFLHLAPAIPAFLARHPDVTVDMSLTDRFVDLVDEGFDVAVRIGRLRDSSLVARRLAPSRLVVCGSPDYLARRGVPRAPEDLAGHECLHNTNVADQWSFAMPGGGVRMVEVSGRLTANNGDALQAAARAGAGLVYLPSFIVGDDLQAGRLVSVLDAFTMVGATVNAVYPHGRHLSP